MHLRSRGRAARCGLLLLIPLFAGCAGMGWGDVLGGLPLGGNVRGEVDRVDTRRREISVRGSWSGRETVRYDSRTRVIYQQRNYRVTDLERGDMVTIDVDSDSRGRRYARTVRVERSTREADRRRSRSDRIERFDGRVTWVERNRGQFGLEAGRYAYTVSVPARAERGTLRRFDRLRRGDRVRLEGVERDRGWVQLHRFR